MRTVDRSSPVIFVSARDDERNAILWVIGELDEYTVGAFEAELERLLPTSRSLIVELSSCSFISASALAVLVRFRRRLSGGPVALVTESPHLVKVLRIASLEQLFPRFENVVDALVAVGETAAEAATAEARGVSRLPERTAQRPELRLLETA